MSDQVVKPNTQFEIKSAVTLKVDEIQILTLLYQPLIGPEALSLFLTLHATVAKAKDKVMTHQLFLQILNTSIDNFLQWRYKLEAVGLLQIYVANDTYTYRLNSPLSSKNFFNDGIINVFLNLKVGNTDYQQLKQYFVIEEPEIEGELISKTFNEVFDTTVIMRSHQMLQASPLPASNEDKNGIELEYVFNLELLSALLRQKGFEEGTLSDKLFEQLNKIAFLYKLDEHELARLIFDATDPDGFVNVETFRKQAKQYFQFINKGKPIEIIERIHQESRQGGLVENLPETGSKEDRLLSFLSQNPLDFLKHKYHQKQPVPADRQLVEWLFMDQQMPAGVVNVLVDYVLKVSDGRLPKQLVEKIAGEWQRKEINTVEKAITQVKKVLDAQKNRELEKKIPAAQNTFVKPSRVIRQEAIPDWLKDSQKESGKDSLTEDDLQKIEQMKKLQSQILNRKG